MVQSCPTCLRAPLSEFAAPEGLCVCNHCRQLFKRAGGGLIPIGSAKAPSVILGSFEAVKDQLTTEELATLARIESLDSLEVVEFVMAVEERLDRTLHL